MEQDDDPHASRAMTDGQRPGSPDHTNQFAEHRHHGNVVQAHTIGGVHHHYPTPKYVPPQQIPAPLRRWGARPDEYASLTDLVNLGRTVIVLHGPDSVGKTALALRWAHHHLDRGPDGCLYADLGEDPDTGPAAPSDVAAGWLLALGVPPDRVPAAFPARVADLRTHTADQRILIVLDDALSAAQVRVLLPVSPHALTVLTSRHRLNGLALDGAAHLPIGHHHTTETD